MSDSFNIELQKFLKNLRPGFIGPVLHWIARFYERRAEARKQWAGKEADKLLQERQSL